MRMHADQEKQTERLGTQRDWAQRETGHRERLGTQSVLVASGNGAFAIAIA